MESIDIVDKLKKFPIAEWLEASVEIIRLRELLNQAPDPYVPRVSGTHIHDSYGNPIYEGDLFEKPIDSLLKKLEAPVTSITVDPNALTVDDVINGLKAELITVKEGLAAEKAKTEGLFTVISVLESDLVVANDEIKRLKSIPEVNIDNYPAVTSLRSQVSNLRVELMDKTGKLADINSKLEASLAVPLVVVKDLETVSTELVALKSEHTDLLDAYNNVKADFAKVTDNHETIQGKLSIAVKNYEIEKAHVKELLAKVSNTEKGATTMFKNIFRRTI